MAVMWLISRIRGRKTALTNQADKRSAEERTLEEQLIDAEAWLDTVLRLPPSEFGIKVANGVIIQHSIDAKDVSIAIAQARLAGLKTRLRLTQRLAKTKATTGVQKNATRKEWQNHGE